jgi:hypothetical protein
VAGAGDAHGCALLDERLQTGSGQRRREDDPEPHDPEQRRGGHGGQCPVTGGTPAVADPADSDVGQRLQHRQPPAGPGDETVAPGRDRQTADVEAVQVRAVRVGSVQVGA